ncbi:hypothetical protein Sinac_7355 [Singulisphaera acidiphila DSM 18658]|uniref:Uncharacterized protein n=2 Tax=Singulisphaera acidiphila TaxID=466153 RepID=L0DPV6_SINAD|nr:hypothetical protein Sinac_7355 [Singulisphaera acidiphila DSM 18658]
MPGRPKSRGIDAPTRRKIWLVRPLDPIDPVLAVGCVPGDEMMIMRLRMFAASLVAAVAIGQAGCSIVAPRPVAENPLLVPSADYETVWKTTVAVLDEYFDIATENRLSHTIVTQPKNGATLLEPWNGDSVGFDERLESTMQTIRRFARATITQAPNGGYVVKVEVHKELEDLARPERAAAGRAVFNNDFPVNRSREIVGPVPVPNGWIRLNRDSKLEQVILQRIRDELFL